MARLVGEAKNGEARRYAEFRYCSSAWKSASLGGRALAAVAA